MATVKRADLHDPRLSAYEQHEQCDVYHVFPQEKRSKSWFRRLLSAFLSNPAPVAAEPSFIPIPAREPNFAAARIEPVVAAPIVIRAPSPTPERMVGRRAAGMRLDPARGLLERDLRRNVGVERPRKAD